MSRPGPGEWIAGARPRTLGAGVVPVLIGAAAAREMIWWRLGAALVVALGLQIGVNYANDYFDGIRGVDTAERVGPPRLTAGGRASPRAVLTAALLSLGIAAAAGLALALVTEPVAILALGAIALIAALLYSGGPKPYAGLGLGEAVVFCCFGLFAVCGTAYVLAGTIPASAWWAGTAIGWLAVAILVANNLRDISTDDTAGKRTLAVRIGDRATRGLYQGVVVLAFATVVAGVLAGLANDAVGLTPWALMALIAFPMAVRPFGAARLAQGHALVGVLVGTAGLHAAFGLALALGLALGWIT